MSWSVRRCVTLSQLTAFTSSMHPLKWLALRRAWWLLYLLAKNSYLRTQNWGQRQRTQWPRDTLPGPGELSQLPSNSGTAKPLFPPHYFYRYIQCPSWLFILRKEIHITSMWSQTVRQREKKKKKTRKPNEVSKINLPTCQWCISQLETTDWLSEHIVEAWRPYISFIPMLTHPPEDIIVFGFPWFPCFENI